MIHWYSLRFPIFIPAQESKWVKNVSSFVSEVPSRICIVGNPLSRSNGIGMGWIVAEHLNIPSEITNNWDSFEIYSLISFFFFHAGVLSILRISILIVFYPVAIIGQVLILFNVSYVGVIHSPTWDIRIVVFPLFCVCEAFVLTTSWRTTSSQLNGWVLLCNSWDWSVLCFHI